MADYKERRREVKKVLMNNLVLTEDKKLAVGPNIRVTLWGVGDGAGETFLFGIKQKSYLMESEFSNGTQSIFKAEEMMKDMGRLLKLETAEEGACVLIRHIFFRPVVLILEEIEVEDSEKLLVLTAYCGRAILTSLSIAHAINQFEKHANGKIKRYAAPKQ